MKHIVLPLTLAVLISFPIQAQEDQEPNLMEQGMELFWEGLRQEMAPTLDELRLLAEELGPSMRGFLSEMGPALAEIANQVEDWSTYELPEILPNGDIIIRKKLAPVDPDQPAPTGPTDI